MRGIVSAAIALLSLAPSVKAATKTEERLTELVAAVRSADYRGDRVALARLDDELGRLDAGRLKDYREYWRGFALWRRVLNGFSVKPAPDDLAADVEKALARFKSALA